MEVGSEERVSKGSEEVIKEVIYSSNLHLSLTLVVVTYISKLYIHNLQLQNIFFFLWKFNLKVFYGFVQKEYVYKEKKISRIFI